MKTFRLIPINKTTRNLLFVGLGFGLFVLCLAIWTPTGHALDKHYYDDDAPCDLEPACTQVDLFAAQTRFVQKSGNYLKAYFKSPTGTKIMINNYNFCDGQSGDYIQEGDYYDAHYSDLYPPTEPLTVTHYTVGQQSLAGSAYPITDEHCKSLQTFDYDLKPADIQFDPGIGLYYTLITVDPADVYPGLGGDDPNCTGDPHGGTVGDCDGIENMFYVTEGNKDGEAGDNNVAVVQQGGTTGYGVTVDERYESTPEDPNPPRFLTYKIEFGSDCTIAGGDQPNGPGQKAVYYYDLDQKGGDGAQIELPIRMTLEETLQDGSVNTQDWTPVDGESHFDFQPHKNAKYVWYIRDVYNNNTIQFSTPFDGIYYKYTCSPPVLTCGTMDVPTDIEPGTSIKIVTHVMVKPAGDGPLPPPGSSGAMHITDPNSVGYDPPVTLGWSAPGGIGDLSITTTPDFYVSAAGEYKVRWIGTVYGQTIECRDSWSFYSLYRPYVSVNGGDVVAGASFATVTDKTVIPCDDPSTKHIPEAGIVSWNKDVPPFIGAGGEYATFAMSHIQDFATDKGSPGTPTIYSLSNDTSDARVPIDISNGLFGGMFGQVAQCVNYWGTKPKLSGLDTLPGGGTTSLTNIKPGQTATYAYTGGNLTIQASTIAPKTHLTIYVEGDVAIQAGGIVYNQPSNWTSIEDIPSITLIAHGTIFLDSGMTQLDGTYVAVPNSSYAAGGTPASFNAPLNGTISTCSNGFDSYDPTKKTSEMITACGNQLTVNGSLIGYQLWFLRTSGTLTGGPPGEIINYNPEVWLAPAAGAQYNPTYKSIIGLPPTL